ncbi:MAG TPA: hypothetical protein PLL80_00305 [Candidatus Pacearchaeota archaeon]|nr:hypothetical protein [Candidatus Pacearchaeota archaeon]HOK93972.1 hypothetical protein [Candidatus Pacearchaeota archaeon]HPO75043.1 hypothetical protein [Candidatus Pacearchaeota archaeon]
MVEISEEDLQKKYELLPNDLKKALSDPEVSNKVYQIGEELYIPKEKIEILAQITGEVFLGLVNLESLKEELKNNLEISEDIAEKLYQSLYNEVFLSYKGSLEKLEKKETLTVSKEIQEREIEAHEEFLRKKGTDKYREPIDEDEVNEQKPRIVREEGKIKKVF